MRKRRFVHFCLIAFCCWCLSVALTVLGQISMSELLTSGSVEEIVNKTYVQEQSDLQRRIFKDYDRKFRPVQNQSKPIQVSMHVYLMHFSVDQIQQVITLNGHIYMTWIDEIACWDPVQFNNIRITMAKHVSGVNQYFEISKRSHATLTSVTPNRTKVEIYPTFAIQMGCDFDYRDYPFDVQNCALRLYTTNVMAEVDLSIFYNLQPSVMLGWGDQSNKRHISDWELLSVTSNLSFYQNRQYISTRPLSAYDTLATWSVVMVWVEIKRNAGLYWISLATPAFVATSINVFSFLLPQVSHALLATIMNFFIQSVFTRDSIKALPPAVGESPTIVKQGNALLFLTFSALCLHLFSQKLRQKKIAVPQKIVPIVQPFIVYFRRKGKEGDQQMSSSDQPSVEEGRSVLATNGFAGPLVIEALSLFRHACLVVYLLISVYIVISLL